MLNNDKATAQTYTQGVIRSMRQVIFLKYNILTICFAYVQENVLIFRNKTKTSHWLNATTKPKFNPFHVICFYHKILLATMKINIVCLIRHFKIIVNNIHFCFILLPLHNNGHYIEINLLKINLVHHNKIIYLFFLTQILVHLLKFIHTISYI